jgi:hypothetical protein
MFLIASVTFATLTISFTSWTRIIFAPFMIEMATAAAVPSSLSVTGTSPSILPINAFLDGPIRIGFSKRVNSRRLLIISRLWLNVFPKPIQGQLLFYLQAFLILKLF